MTTPGRADAPTSVVRLGRGRIRAVVLPRLGGRVISLTVGDREVLWRDPALFGAGPAGAGIVPRHGARPGPDGWLNWGGEKTWPAPQGWEGDGRWPGPPDDVIDGGAHAVVSASADRVALVSGDDPATGLRAEREIRVEDDGVVIAGAVRNVSAGPRRWAAWSVAQLPFGAADVASDVAGIAVSGCGAPRALFAPLGAVPWEAGGGVRVRFADVVGKLGFPVPGAATVRAEATWADGFRAVMSFEAPDADHPDGSPFQLWMQTEVDGALPGLGDMTATARYVELEALSPLRDLAPGEALGVTVRWSFPG